MGENRRYPAPSLLWIGLVAAGQPAAGDDAIGVKSPRTNAGEESMR
jgi:hypothetical protein